MSCHVRGTVECAKRTNAMLIARQPSNEGSLPSNFGIDWGWDMRSGL
jgi:hypothetical protein